MKLQPKARKVKFRLNIGGVEISDIEGLRDHFCLAEIMKSIRDGQFTRWLEYLGENELFVSVEDWKINGGDSLALVKLFFNDYNRYADATELVISECQNPSFKLLLPEMMAHPGLDVDRIFKAFESLKDRGLMNMLLCAHGKSEAVARIIAHQKMIGLVYGVRKFAEGKRDIWLERKQLPPAAYYPADFRLPGGRRFLSNMRKIRDERPPRWFSETKYGTDLWEILVISFNILNKLNFTSESGIKDKLIRHATMLSQASSDNHFYVERLFIAALIYHHYSATEDRLSDPNRDRCLREIRFRYVPASILYDNWNQAPSRFVVFYDSEWPTDSNALKTISFLYRSLGEKIALVVANMFDLSLYQ